MEITPEKFDNFALWIKQNKGRKFKIKECEQKTYIDDKGNTRALEFAPFKCYDTLMLYVGEYLKRYQSEMGDIPQIELKNDFTQIKIYINENKIWTE
jgi:hypothetical protein